MPSAPPRCRPTPGRTWPRPTTGDAAAVRQRHPGRLDRAHRRDRDLDQPAADRRRQHLRPVLRRADRRGPHLQRRAHRRPDPDRHGHAVRSAVGHDPAVAAGDADRDRGQQPARSTCPGAPPPTTSASPATGSSAARAPAAPTSPRSPPPPAPAPPTRTPASAPPPATATASAPPTPPATSAPTRTSLRRRRRRSAQPPSWPSSRAPPTPPPVPPSPRP